MPLEVEEVVKWVLAHGVEWVPVKPALVLTAIFLRILLAVALSQQPLGAENDALLYHESGTHYAWSFWADRHWSRIDWDWGTSNYALFTGAFYSVFGPHRLPIMLFNSALACIGSLLLLRVLESRYPGAHPLLKVLTLLDPSMLYWTSIHGKDPLMFLFLALAAHGMDRWVRDERAGKIEFAVATVLMFFIRPHIALIVVLAALFGFARYRIFAFAMIPLLGAVVITVASGYYMERVSALSYGSSAVAVQDNPAKHALYGIGAALFRPFPWEGGSVALRIAGAWGIVTSVAILLILRGIWRKKYILSFPFRRFLLAYCSGIVLFIGLLAANLGTIARERIQLTAFLWLLLASVQFPAHTYRSTSVPVPVKVTAFPAV